MILSETTAQLYFKILKILSLLLLVRLSLYIPVPNIDLDIFSQGQPINSMFAFARTLTGSSFLAIGSLGILPYINSSILIQLLVSLIPSLERIQKEEGEIGRQKISQYTRYLTFIWAVILSSLIALFVVKPLVFNWDNITAVQVILSLTTGSLLSMWFAELISAENLGNGSSMIIFINIIGSIPNSFNELSKKLSGLSFIELFTLIGQGISIYIFVVFVIVLFQDAYKKITIVSAKQLNVNSSVTSQQYNDLKNSYIPIKLNQGGIMPLVFSSTIVSFLYYPVQFLLSSPNITFGYLVPNILTIYSLVLNVILVIFFSGFYSLLVLKPNDISQNLAKMSYIIPGIRQGKQTTQYLKQIVSRLAFMGGLFLSCLAFGPFVLGNFFQFNLFKNLTSLLILVGVITDVTSQIRGYLISRNYEGFKKT